MDSIKTLRQIFAYNLRKRRVQLEISQEELAYLCGLHRTYISDIERCRRNISIDNIEKIARALNISSYQLLKEDTQNENC